MHRLYFSHSYDPEDLRFNEHVWKLLASVGFHAWIDTGREVSSGSSAGLPGARRPMDISFNEWMMSQCDGFAAIVPKRRASPYQLLEYRTAVRMGVPRLIAVEEDAGFGASYSETVEFPTSWRLFWDDATQARLGGKIADFAERVKNHKAAGEVLHAIGHWRPRRNSNRLNVALLPPRADDDEWQKLQAALQESDEVDWTLLSPANIRVEGELLSPDKWVDLLVVDVGPRGTPQEALGYIHARGIPQIRVCRVHDEEELESLGRHLGAAQRRRRRFVYEQYPPAVIAHAPALPRFLDGLKLDGQMQPVIFWTTHAEAARHIRETIDHILMFRAGLSPEGVVTRETIDTRQSARKYFDQYWDRAGRGAVFLSFAGGGEAAKLADRLAGILRFQNLRCFHYREKDSSIGARLDSGEDVIKGLELRIEAADIIVYLIDDKFIDSDYCRGELAQGRTLRERGMVEFRAYSMDSLRRDFPPEVGGLSVHKFREGDWNHAEVEQKIVDDVEKSAEAFPWALREKDRDTLADWLKHDERDSIEGVSKVLKAMGVPDGEIESLAEAAKDDPKAWLNGLLRLPKTRQKQRRARQLVALLLLGLSSEAPERAEKVCRWLYERRLVQWPPLVAAQNEDHVVIKGTYVIGAGDAFEVIKAVGQKLGQEYQRFLRGDNRPLVVTAESDFLSVPIEWARETQDDEPLAVRHPIRWRLPGAEGRTSIFDHIAANAVPPTTLILSLAGPLIKQQEQTRKLSRLLVSCYDALDWPPELVRIFQADHVDDVLLRLKRCQEQVLHIAGHMGDAGLQIGDELLPAAELATALRDSDVRIVILNGCEGGKPGSQLASAYLTLADRLIRDGRINEVVAHRCKISQDDAQAFAEAFHSTFFEKNEGFDCARSALSGRKAGSQLLRYSPVVISQRRQAGQHT